MADISRLPTIRMQIAAMAGRRSGLLRLLKSPGVCTCSPPSPPVVGKQDEAFGGVTSPNG